MATPNRHQHINCNNSGNLAIDSAQAQVSELANYELAYHHHLQTALQMGQFYNPDQLGHPSAAAAAAAAAALRSSASSSSGGALRLVDGSGTGTQNACHSLWDNNARGQRGAMTGYHHHPHGPADLLSVTSALQCDIWPTAPATSLTNGRLPGNGHPQRFGGTKSSSKKPRRRVATIAQRRAANIRERRRMFNLNEAFDKLRRKVPTFAYEKRLSRIETLRLAITYISFMRDLITVPDPVKSSSGSNERVGKISQSHQNNNGQLNHNHCQYTSSSNNSNGVLGMDCMQNQNVPPPISPFNPMGRLYSPHLHHPAAPYLPSGIPQ